MKSYIYYLFLMLIVLASCEEKENMIETGYLCVNPSMDYSLVTKAVESDSLQMSIAICKAATGDTVKYFENYKTDLGNEKITLAVGKYHVKAGSPHSGKAAFDKPFYFGIDTIDVVKYTIKESEVVCTLANVKVTVNYSDMLKKFFTGYQATISNASGELTFEEDEKRAGYFTPGKLNVTLNLINNDGTAYKIVKEIPDTKAREHYRLTFSVGEEPDDPEAGGDFDITVDEETNDIECTLNVPVFTDDYGRNVPKIDIDASKITEDHLMNIVAGKAGEDYLQVSMSSEKTGLSLVALNLKSDYFDQKGVSGYWDLTKLDDNAKSLLSAVGIICAPVDSNSKTAMIDFNGLLKSNPFDDPEWVEHGPIINTITVIVRDLLGQQVEESITIRLRPDVAVQTLEPTPWPYRVYLKGLAGDNTDLKFLFREVGDDDTKWQSISVLSSDVNETEDGYEFTALIKDLSVNTDYEYKAMAGESEGKIIPFTTEGISGKFTVPNLTFDEWAKNGKNWFPNAISDREDSNFWWDSGNQGANTVGEKNPTSPEETDVKKGKAARLGSTSVAGVFAAGSLFTGTFGKVEGLSGASLNFGHSYTGHPTKLKGYYKYNSGKITHTKKDFIKKDDQDSCHIYVALCDWKSAYPVNTNTGSFVDLSDESIIAFGEFKSNTTVSAYTEITIDIKYRHPEVKPTYILIVASASKYGDYFTGSTSSVLLLDEFELLFDDPVE